MDKTKCAPTSQKESNFSDISQWTNVVNWTQYYVGKRSTSKTLTLDAIANRFGGKAKYIKQFELLNTGRNDS
ncbi:MAG: hypothetical protein ACLR1G_12165 [Alistipes indistinctus]